MQIDLASIDWQPTKQKGISLFTMLHREETRDIVVLIRMQPGCGYPRHRHVGEERVLVLQGGYRDERGEYRTGDWVISPAGSVHSPVALEGDEACVLLAAAEHGVEVLEPRG